jgi:WD40 repeat protein
MTSESVDVICLLDVRTRQFLFHLQHFGVHSAAFSLDGSKLASAPSAGNLNIWDVSTSAGKRGSDHLVHTFQGTARQFSVSYSPNGLGIASISGDRRTVRIWREALTFTPCPKPSSDFALHRASTSLPMHPKSMDPSHTPWYRDIVRDDGWVHTAAGQRVIWVPYAGGMVTVKSNSLTVVPPCISVPTSE